MVDVDRSESGGRSVKSAGRRSESAGRSVKGDARAPKDQTDAPESDADASKDDADAPESDARASKGDSDAPKGAADDPDDDDGPLEGDDPTAPPLAPEVVRKFLGSKKAFEVAKAAVAKRVPSQEVGDLAMLALEDALAAPPPHAEAALVSWLHRIARRRAADWLRKRARRKKYEGEMPSHVAREDDYTGETLAEDGDGDRASGEGAVELSDDDADDLLGPHLERLVGDNAKERELLDMLRERANGKPLKTIAAERGYTEDQLTSRIQRFKKKYEEPVRRRRQRLFLFKLFGVAAAIAVAAVLAWWWLHRGDAIRRDPSRAPPAPSASASAAPPEPFMPANPTDESPEGPPSKR